jgi:hypothetical protein
MRIFLLLNEKRHSLFIVYDTKAVLRLFLCVSHSINRGVSQFSAICLHIILPEVFAHKTPQVLYLERCSPCIVPVNMAPAGHRMKTLQN